MEEELKVTCVNDVHWEKHSSPIDVTDDGIVIWDKEEQLWKLLVPSDVTDDGIVICANDEQDSKQ